MGANCKVTAESARISASKPERLLNCILKNIKECSEMGGTQMQFNFSDLMSEGIDYVVDNLEELDFKVKTFTEIDHRQISQDGFIDHLDVAFVISW